MKERTTSPHRLTEFASFLRAEERSAATVEKYTRDVRALLSFLGGKAPTKEEILAYKTWLGEHYAVSSANSMLAAANTYLRFLGMHSLCVKQFRVQRDAFRPEEKELTREEYLRLVKAAARQGNERLNLVLQTICATGIRVSELRHITVEALHRGEASVTGKGKTRRIFLVSALCRRLLQYAKQRKIHTGCVFLTGRGRPLGRITVWKEMKQLCLQAGVPPCKVFPHNLRHLFARTFYGIEHDIAKLADILGHASIQTTRIYIMTTYHEHRRKMEHMRLVI